MQTTPKNKTQNTSLFLHGVCSPLLVFNYGHQKVREWLTKICIRQIFNLTTEFCFWLFYFSWNSAGKTWESGQDREEKERSLRQTRGDRKFKRGNGTGNRVTCLSQFHCFFLSGCPTCITELLSLLHRSADMRPFTHFNTDRVYSKFVRSGRFCFHLDERM